MNLEELKEKCEFEMYIETNICLKLIEIIGSQKKEIERLKSNEKMPFEIFKKK